MNVKIVLSNDNLDKNIYMVQENIYGKKASNRKSVYCNYALEQASKSLNIRFDKGIKSYGYDQAVNEHCVTKG